MLLEYGKPFYARFIDSSAQHSAAITLDGKLYTWGLGNPLLIVNYTKTK